MRRELGFNRGSANRWLNTRFVAHLTSNLEAADAPRLAGQLTVRELRSILAIQASRPTFGDGMTDYLNAELRG